MHRWAPLNSRQADLLKRIAAGEDPCAQDPGLRRSAYALRDRGLADVTRRRGVWQAQVTEAGRFYLEHGHHPDHPAHQNGEAPAEVGEEPKKPRGTATRRHPAPPAAAGGAGRKVKEKKAPTPYSERPTALRRRASAAKLVERLVEEKRVTISDPSEEEITEWRRVIDYAKRHGLAPPDTRIEKQRLWNRGRDLQISLVHGPHANSRRQAPDNLPPVPVPAQLRSPHPAVAALRDDKDRLVMPPALRRRALLLLQAIAAEAGRRQHKVHEHPVAERYRSRAYSYAGQYYPSRYSRREGEMDLTVNGFKYTVTIKQEAPESKDPERSERLTIEIGYSRSGRQYRWSDRKRWKLEDVLGAVLQELEHRAVEDRQRQEDEERARRERKERWTAAMKVAREQAKQAHLAGVLREQARSWQEARALREYCDALERRIGDVAEGDAETAVARQWLAWARGYAEATDPLSRLPTMPTPPTPGPEDLKPYLNGWSPYGPENRSYGWEG